MSNNLERPQNKLDSDRMCRMSDALISEGYAEAKAMVGNLKAQADALDAKAMKFIEFLVTIIIALVAAFWLLLDRGAETVFLIVTCVEMITASASAAIMALGVVSGTDFYFPGEFPEEFFHNKALDWYRSVPADERDRRFTIYRIKALSEYAGYNEKVLVRMVRRYRLSVRLFVLSSILTGMAFLFFGLMG